LAIDISQPIPSPAEVHLLGQRFTQVIFLSARIYASVGSFSAVVVEITPYPWNFILQKTFRISQLRLSESNPDQIHFIL